MLRGFHHSRHDLEHGNVIDRAPRSKIYVVAGQLTLSATRAAIAGLSRFVNDQDLPHEIFVITVSYIFVFAGAWNDSLLGLVPTIESRLLEVAMAAALFLEIASRLSFTRRRDRKFWALLMLDTASVMTVAANLRWFGFARLVRMAYASARVVRLVDSLACRTGNTFYLLGLYPLVIPLAAAALYAVEHQAANTPVHNYIEALAVCFTFALSLGNIRPVSTAGMIICGTLFLLGIVCIGIISNTISSRYGTMTDKPSCDP